MSLYRAVRHTDWIFIVGYSLAVDETMNLSYDTAGLHPPGPESLQLFALSCRDLAVG
jgi:hypothetical protein